MLDILKKSMYNSRRGNEFLKNHGGYKMKQKTFNQLLFAVVLSAIMSAFIVGTSFSAVIGDLKTKGNLGGIGDDIAYGVSAYKNGDFIIAGEVDYTSLNSGDFMSLLPLGGTDGIITIFNYDSVYENYSPGYMENIGGSYDDTLRSIIVNDKTGGFVAVGEDNDDGIFVMSDGDFGTASDTYILSSLYEDRINAIAQWNTAGFSHYVAVGLYNGIPGTFGLYNLASGAYDPSAGIIAGNGMLNDIKVLGNDIVFVGTLEFNPIFFPGVTPRGGMDAVIMILSSTGNTLTKNFGGNGVDTFNKVAITSDGGYVAVGFSMSNSFGTGDWVGVLSKGGLMDAMMVKFDSNGGIVWKKNFGGNGNDMFTGITATSDGGFVVVGNSTDPSFGTGDLYDLSGNGGTDAIIVKFDENGDFIWQKNFGGADEDFFYDVDVKTNGDIIAVGQSLEGSFGTGDLSTLSAKGTSDIIYAVYKDVDTYIMKFLKYANNEDVIYEEKVVASGKKITPPIETPIRYGFDFVGWYSDEKCTTPFDFNAPINADAFVYPLWQAVGIDVTVTYNPGTGIKTMSAKYGQGVRVIAANTGIPFSHWVDGNGNIRSYEQSYSFVSMEDITLTAVFSASALTPEPTVNIDTSNIIRVDTAYTNRMNISFFGDIVVPDSFTIVERGFLGSYVSIGEVNIDGTSNVNLQLTDVGSRAVRVLVPGINTKVQATFLSVLESPDWAYAARSYLIYEDGTSQYIIYSPDVSCYLSDVFKTNNQL